MEGLYTNNNYIQAPVFSQASSVLDTNPGSVPNSVFTDPRLNMLTGRGESMGRPTMPFTLNSAPTGLNSSHVTMPYSTPMSSAIMTSLSSVATMSAGLGVTAPGSFTFTSPTRLSHVSSQSQTYPYGQFSTNQSTLPTFAPGMGVSWQHTVPAQMPWTECSSTAVPPNFGSSVVYSSTESPGIQPCPVGEPVASCSAPIRRPKRTALDAGCETPSKVYITEEKMMASMQELSLNHSESSDKALVHNSNNTTTSTTALTPVQSSVERSWQKFRELEDMLADEQIDTELTEVKNTGFKVHINTSVANSIICSSIPKAVLENINKPCLQVVLWKPPVDKLREIVSENVHKNRQKNNSSKQKSSGQSGMRSPTSRTSTATPTCAIDNRQQPDVTVLSSMECEEEDSAMEL